MRKFTLKFLDSSLENDFQSVNKSFMMMKFYLFYRIQMIFMVIMFVITVFRDNFSMIQLAGLFAVICFIIINILLKKYLKIIFKTIIVMVFSLIDLLIVEIIKISMIDDINFKPACLMLTLAFGFYITLLLLSRANWIFCLSVYIFNIGYLFIRIYNFKKMDYKEENIVGTLILIISFGVIAYMQEKSNREYFKKLRDSNENLKQFKVVMQSILPSSVFIVNYQDNILEFLNKTAVKFIAKHKKMLSEIYDERAEFITFSRLEAKENDVLNTKLEGFEEIIDNFKILDQNNEQIASDKKMTKILRKFSRKIIEKNNLINKKNNAFNIENKDFINSGLFTNDSGDDFITLHVSTASSYESVDRPELNIADCKTNEISFSNKFYYEVKIAQILWDGKPCLFIIFNDNTNSKRIIELINLDKYKNQMLATVSHDLRTPLNGVIGMMNTVLTNINDKENRKNLIIGIRSANLLNFLINDILDFSQISYKKLRLNVERINLRELVSEIFNLMKTQAKIKKIDFSWEIKENEIIYSDSNRVKQILLNLLGNAIKFTNKGFILLKVEKIEDIQSRIFKFSVEDSGIGIKEEDISKLFVLFGKLKQENPEINKTGIGFGLTISNTLAKMLYSGPDAGIHVKSIYGEGSNFSFKIDGGSEELENFSFIDEKFNNDTNNDTVITKMARYDSLASLDKSLIYPRTSILSTSLQECEISQNLNMKKILVVDDDAINIMILTKYLEFFKLEYLTAMNGKEAIGIIEKEIIIKNNEISAILMDCNMPVMDGFQATENIIKLLNTNQKKEIPIIAVTANVTNADLDLCLKSGMKKFLPKPVRRKDLGVILQKMFKIKLPLE